MILQKNFFKSISVISVLAITFMFLVSSFSVAEAATSDRWAGSDRYDTAVQISRNTWGPKNTKNVYIARGDVTADALVAGALPNGPVLLTPPTKVLSNVKNEISRLGNPNIVIIGGQNAVNDSVARSYSNNKNYVRLDGVSRDDTAVKVSQFAWKNSSGLKTVYLTDGWGSNPSLGGPDGVVGGVLTDGPILTVNPKVGASQVVKNEISRLKKLGATRVYSLGGNNTGYPIDKKISGSNRFLSAIEISKYAFSSKPTSVYLANGAVFVDAISGGTVEDGVILLTQPKQLPPEVCTYLKNNNPSRVVALGGINSIDDNVLNTAKNCATSTSTVQEVTPKAPTFTKASKCGVQHTVTLPENVFGVKYTKTTSGNNVTVTSSAMSGYKLKAGSTTSWNFNIAAEKCPTIPPTIVEVTTKAPTLVKNSQCNVQHTVSIPAVVGITYTKKVTGNSVNITASANSGYKLKQGSVTSWNFDITPDKCSTNPIVVVPTIPTFTKSSTCGVKHTVTLPDVADGIKYTKTTSGNNVKVTAEAMTGYAIKAGSTTVWNYDITPTTCPKPDIEITPTSPTLVKSPTCGVQHTVNIPNITGLKYSKTVTGNNVKVTVSALTDYKIKAGSVSTWNYDVTPAECIKTCGEDFLGNPLPCDIGTVSDVVGYITVNEKCGKELACLRLPTQAEIEVFEFTDVPKIGDKIPDDYTNFFWMDATTPTNEFYPVAVPDWLEYLNNYRVSKGSKEISEFPNISMTISNVFSKGQGAFAQEHSMVLAESNYQGNNGESGHSDNDARANWYKSKYPEIDFMTFGENIAITSVHDARTTESLFSVWRGSLGHDTYLLNPHSLAAMGAVRDSSGNIWITYQGGTVWGDWD